MDYRMKKPKSDHKRMQVVIWVLVVLVVVLGAALVYSKSSPKSKSPSPSPTPNVSSQPSASPSATTQATATPRSVVAGVGECKTSQLHASVLPSNSAAGTFYQTLVLTNSSGTNCVVEGYPGVSLTSASGATLGQPATRDTVTT